MRQILKNIAMAAVVMLLTLVIWGCRSDSDSSNITDQKTSVEDGFYIYYINDGWTDISMKKMDVDQQLSSENTVDMVMKALLEGGGTSKFGTPVPTGMTIRGIYMMGMERSVSYLKLILRMLIRML